MQSSELQITPGIPCSPQQQLETVGLFFPCISDKTQLTIIITVLKNQSEGHHLVQDIIEMAPVPLENTGVFF